MAEKGFGVKEVNLIGASGTPTITSPNNLNLNANNVAISTNVSIGGTLSVTGNVSVGGTLTYEDVTNIDSVGLITARSGVVVGAGKSILVGAGVTISSSTKGDIQISGIATANTFVAKGGNVNVDIGSLNQGFYLNNSGSTHLGLSWSSSASSNYLSGTGSHPLNITNFAGISILPSSGACSLGYAGSGKLQTTSTGVNVTGAITVNGSALSIDPTNSDIQVVYTVTANGSSAYRFAGNGVVSTADNPDLYLIRGKKYRFINNSGGSHPFQIRESSGGTAYSTGVTNNGAASGNIDFAPTFDSPAQLVYQCTSHGGMVGNIYLRGGSGGETNVGVITATGSITTASGTMTIGFQDHTSGNTSPTTATGYYERIGNMVHCSIDTGSIQKGSMQSGQILLLTGCFPITRDNNWHIAGSTYHYNVNTSANGGGHQVVAAKGYWLSNTSMYFVIPRNNSTSDNLTVSMMSGNSARFFMNYSYKVN